MFNFAVYVELAGKHSHVYLILIKYLDIVLPLSGLTEGYCPETKSNVVFDYSEIKHIHFLGREE